MFPILSQLPVPNLIPPQHIVLNAVIDLICALSTMLYLGYRAAPARFAVRLPETPVFHAIVVDGYVLGLTGALFAVARLLRCPFLAEYELIAGFALLIMLLLAKLVVIDPLFLYSVP